MFGKKNAEEKGIKLRVEVRDQDAIVASELAFSKLKRASKVLLPMALGSAGLNYLAIQLYSWGVSLDSALGKMPLTSESANQGAKVIGEHITMIFNASSFINATSEGMIFAVAGCGAYYAGSAAISYIFSRPKRIDGGIVKRE